MVHLRQFFSARVAATDTKKTKSIVPIFADLHYELFYCGDTNLTFACTSVVDQLDHTELQSITQLCTLRGDKLKTIAQV